MTENQHQPICKGCGHDLEWIDCWNGCEDGYFDGFEEDPLWYDAGDFYPCGQCQGKGGWFGCVNTHSLEDVKRK